jgi:diacylglycerol kinase family enzyme
MDDGGMPHSREAAAPADRRTRWMARLAFVAAAAPLLLLPVIAGVRASLALVLIGGSGIAVTLAAAWWFLSHHGFARWLSAVVILGAPLTVALLYVQQHLIWVVVVLTALWAATITFARAALSRVKRRPSHEAPPPARPFLIMNPRSGGGKVVRAGLAEKARELGAEVLLLTDGTGPIADIARQAVRDGADLLGVAGGDGTQALVAAVAAESDVPFLVIAAGTRNHFALDLGLDRSDPATGLDALVDGVEVRVDLGRAGERVFVNNASFGAYAEVVRQPEYRDDKARTTLDLLPDLITGHQGPHLRMSVNGHDLDGPQAVLVSNNPYGTDDVAGLGRRPRLDGGVLGVLSVHVRGAADAAGLIFGRRPDALFRSTATEVVVDADEPEISVGIDGEAVLLPTPVRCTTVPGALRVRVPRHRPKPPPELDWNRLRHLAAGRR